MEQPDGHEAEPQTVDQKPDVARERNRAQRDDILHAESRDDETRRCVARNLGQSHGIEERLGTSLPRLNTRSRIIRFIVPIASVTARRRKRSARAV